MSLNERDSWYDQEDDNLGRVIHPEPSNKLGLRGWAIFALVAALFALLVWGVTRSEEPQSYGRSDVPGPDWTLAEMQDFWAEMWSGMSPSDKESLCGAASDGRLESAMLDQPDANYASIYGYLGFLQIHCEQEGWL